jgi:dihydroorotase
MLLIKNATIVEPSSKLNGRKRDILINKNGIIESIKANIQAPKAKIFDAKNACISIGWMDVGTQVGDPGFEHREDLQSVAQAAAAGGFTAIAPQPNTIPTIHSKSEVNYIKNKTENDLVDFYPIGAISRDCEGKDITEMYDMHESGAVAFSDGQKTMQNSGLMMRALQYVKAFDGLVMNHPQDAALASEGQMHEGMVSTSLGMKGIPSIAEELMVQRDLYLVEYSDSRLHLFNISTERSVELLKNAKSKGIDVTASVPVLNLIFDETAIAEFDPNYKVLPPLREKPDIRALKRGLKNGVISLITSNHTPLDEEAKNLEFPYADFGIIGLETAYALCNSYLSDVLKTEDIVSILAINPRKLFRLPVPTIKEGAKANLTIFNPNLEWTFAEKDIHSKSKNTPFIGKQFKGKVMGVVNNGKHQFVGK